MPYLQKQPEVGQQQAKASKRLGNAAIAARAATAAQHRAESAHASDVLKERALEAMQHAVGLGLEAHMLCEETAGVERAVGYARKGDPWRIRDKEVEMDILLAAEIARCSMK
jgi:hypothetical protein